MIIYDKLFERLKEKGITTYRIRKDKLLGQGTLTALKSGRGGLDRNTIDKLCKLLDCQPGDLMEYVPEPKTPWQLIDIKTGGLSNTEFNIKQKDGE